MMNRHGLLVAAALVLLAAFGTGAYLPLYARFILLLLFPLRPTLQKLIGLTGNSVS